MDKSVISLVVDGLFDALEEHYARRPAVLIVLHVLRTAAELLVGKVADKVNARIASAPTG